MTFVTVVAESDEGAFNRAMQGRWHPLNEAGMAAARRELAARRRKFRPLDFGFAIYAHVQVPYRTRRELQTPSGLFEGEEEGGWWASRPRLGGSTPLPATWPRQDGELS